MFALVVEKEYSNGEVIAGTAIVEDKEIFYEQMRRRKIQTTDPRIIWECEPEEGTEYVDFSFRVVGIGPNENGVTCPKCLGKITHISQIPKPRTADKIVELLSTPEVDDVYHKAILAGADSLVDMQWGGFIYISQSARGDCVWESEPCTPYSANRVTVTTTPKGKVNI